MAGRCLWIAAFSAPILALLAAITALILGVTEASATSGLTKTFCNGTGQTANDLHIKFNTQVTVSNGGAFSTVSGAGTNVIDLSNGTVADSACTTSDVTGQAPETEVRKWWWTKDGRRFGIYIYLADSLGRDLSEVPLRFTGDSTQDIFLVAEPASTADGIFAVEVQLNATDPTGDTTLPFFMVDLLPNFPGVNMQLSGDSLAYTGKEALIMTQVGSPDDGENLRSCVEDGAGRTGDDSVYTFIKGGTGDSFTDMGLQLLKQHQRYEWGANWCGPTAAGISLAWFAETATGDNLDHANLIPDTNSNAQTDTADKYEAIATLGALMGTSSGGTTDNKFVDGIQKYIDLRGLTGDFSIKTTNHPTFWDYADELEAHEDVLVGITYPGGGGHWLVGRSFSVALKGNGTPNDPSGDYYEVSFVDPGTGTVYHTRVRASNGAIWYNGQWVEFDILVSVSPTDVPTNENTAQYFVAQNQWFFNPQRTTGTGDLLVVLLGDPRPGAQGFRTPQLTGDAQKPMRLARIRVGPHHAGMGSLKLLGDCPLNCPVKVVGVDANGNPFSHVVSFDRVAASIEVEVSLSVKVRLQGAQRPDPAGWIGGTTGDKQLNPVPVTVRLFNPGADVLQTGGAVATFICDPMNKVKGQAFGTCDIDNTPVGTFDVTSKTPHSLINVKRSVEISIGTNVVDMGTQQEADANESGGVFVNDIGLVVGALFSKCGGLGYNPNTDFDNDCGVAIADINLAVGNFFKQSPITVP